jgi:uncharacterized membrane protein
MDIKRVIPFLVMPLLTLVVDGARLYYVRGRIQTAADAACEDAAWSAADRYRFKTEGITTFETNWYAIARAQNTFQRTLGEQTSKNFSAVVVINPDYVQARMNCQAVARVPLLTLGGLMWSPARVEIYSTAKIRFTR